MLQKVAELDVDVFMPGHGDLGNREDVLDEVKLLSDLQAGVKLSIARGDSPDEMLRRLTFPEYKGLCNFDQLHGQLLALRELLVTGKPVIQLP